MATVEVINTSGERVGEVELPESVFGVVPREHLFYAVVRYQLAKRRAGTHDVKERAQVSGGGKKPWKQKGTGRARQGSTRAPHWRGGGVVFGPTPRSHAFALPKKVRAEALRGALSRRLSEQKIRVVDALSFDAPKTKLFAQFLERIASPGALVVVEKRDDLVERVSRNIPGVTVLPVDGLNVYDVLRHGNLVLVKSSIDPIVARLGE